MRPDSRSMTARDVDERVARLAGRQHGAFTRAQALGEGATDRIVGGRLAAGTWLVLEPGTYALAAAPATWHRALMAATLAAGPRAVLSHRAAAALHVLVGFGQGRAEVTIDGSRDGTTKLARVHCSGVLSASDRGRQQGIPVTRPARTIVDIAGSISFHRLVEVYDEAVTTRLVTHDELRRCLERVARRGLRGTAAVRRLLVERGAGGGVPTGRLEQSVLRMLRAGGVPEPVCQFAAPWRNAVRERVDFAWPAQRLVLEADGRRWHTREADFDRDRARDRQAAVLGWTVLRITWDDVSAHSAEVVSQVAACLRAAT